MHNLTEFLAKFHHVFLFLLLEALGAVLLFRYNSYQGSVWFSSANYVVGKVYEAEAHVDAYFHLSALNEQLTQRNVVLEQQVRQLQDALADQSRDSLLTSGAMRFPSGSFHTIPAKVVSNSIDRTDNFITIDRGSADGVRKDMGVVCGTGVVGVVYLVSAHYSVVIPVLNTHSNISCSILKRGYFGYLRWNGGAADVAYVEDIPRHARFWKHDYVVTSGYSSIFPPGVMVGRIMQVYNSKDGLSYRLKVHLATDFANLRDVCVIDDASVAERAEVLRAARDSIGVEKRN